MLYLKQNYALKLFIAFKMAYFDFVDFPKKFYNTRGQIGTSRQVNISFVKS